MKYYISDLHLFHENAIEFDHRPFTSLQEMHNAILKNWNERVTNGDMVYILGDVSTVSYTHSPSPRDRQKSRMPSSA